MRTLQTLEILKQATAVLAALIALFQLIVGNEQRRNESEETRAVVLRLSEKMNEQAAVINAALKLEEN